MPKKTEVRFCPKCFATESRRSRRRGWERFVPFLRAYRCSRCNERFLRGARPPFAFCTRCGTTQLQYTKPKRVRTGLTHPVLLRNLVLNYMGARAYRCPDCRRYFLDRRPLREPEKAVQHHASA